MFVGVSEVGAIGHESVACEEAFFANVLNDHSFDIGYILSGQPSIQFLNASSGLYCERHICVRISLIESIDARNIFF